MGCALTAALLLALWQHASAAEEEKCRELGFVTSELRCASCEKLSATVKDDELIKECFDCCTKGASTMYESARLEVCK